VLSKKTKYAIIALVRLAKEYNSGPVLIRDIAEKENIPQKFLSTILNDLRLAGILGSKKGKGGGYFLRKSPEEVNLAEVLRLFDGAIALTPCVTFVYYEKCEECHDEKTCGIRDVFREVRDESVKILKKATLTEILTREMRLIKENE